jgi:hypothetical protein
LRVFAFFLFFASTLAWALPDCREITKPGASRPQPGESYAQFQKRIPRSTCEKEWSVLVYMEADNDLFPYALLDLFEMEAPFQASGYAASTPKTDLIAEVQSRGDSRRLHLFEGSKPFSNLRAGDLTSLNQIESPVVGRGGRSFSEFLSWGAANYPARHYFVIFWGHGQGWQGIGFNATRGNAQSIPSVRDSLADLASFIRRPLDVYASDACLMQMLEVGYEFSPYVNFLVGSTQVQNFQGLPYRRILYELNSGRFNGERFENRSNADGENEPYLLAKMIPGLARQSLDPVRGSQGRTQTGAQAWMTSSALSSSELKYLFIPAIQKLGAALANYARENPMRRLDLQLALQKVPSLEGSAQDFGIFLSLLESLLASEKEKQPSTKASHELQIATAGARDALYRSVVSYAYGSGYGMDSSSGRNGFFPRAVSIWLPASKKEFFSHREEFSSSAFYRDTGWASWLELVYGP